MQIHDAHVCTEETKGIERRCSLTSEFMPIRSALAIGIYPGSVLCLDAVHRQHRRLYTQRKHLSPLSWLSFLLRRYFPPNLWPVMGSSSTFNVIRLLARAASEGDTTSPPDVSPAFDLVSLYSGHLTGKRLASTFLVNFC